MKYYFTAQMNGTTAPTKKRYQDIVSELARIGHSNLNIYHMPDSTPAKIKTLASLRDKRIDPFDYQQKILLTADALICDITDHSATVGYQVLFAINNKIPCLALYFGAKPVNGQPGPSVIFNQTHNGLMQLSYVSSLNELEGIFDTFKAEHVHKPLKFNFYMPLDLHNKLAQRAASIGKTKSELVRDIITDYTSSRDKTDNAERNRHD